MFRNGLNRFDETVRDAESGVWASVTVLRPTSGGPVAIYVDEQIGVTETPLEHFIEGAPYAVFRIRGLEEHRSEELHAGPMALFAGITALETPYDYEIIFENKKFYNAELVFATALNAGFILGKLNSPEFLRRLRVSSSAAVRTRQATASRSSHACASDCRTSRCNRTRPALRLRGSGRFCA